MGDREYFKRAIPLNSLYKVAYSVRRQIFKTFMKTMQPFPHEKIVDIGVFAGSENPDDNFLEQLYPYPQNITALGVEDASFLQQQYPGLEFVRIVPGKPLPFSDNEFNIGFSSATIEHVGSYQEQRFFLKEAIRVSGRFFLATPNRFYPLEFHTLLPFLHWLPQPVFRKILKQLKIDFYSREENLNLLDKKRLLDLIPEEYSKKSKLFYQRFLGLVSNLLLVVVK